MSELPRENADTAEPASADDGALQQDSQRSAENSAQKRQNLLDPPVGLCGVAGCTEGAHPSDPGVCARGHFLPGNTKRGSVNARRYLRSQQAHIEKQADRFLSMFGFSRAIPLAVIEAEEAARLDALMEHALSNNNTPTYLSLLRARQEHLARLSAIEAPAPRDLSELTIDDLRAKHRRLGQMLEQHEAETRRQPQPEPGSPAGRPAESPTTARTQPPPAFAMPVSPAPAAGVSEPEAEPEPVRHYGRLVEQADIDAMLRGCSDQDRDRIRREPQTRQLERARAWLQQTGSR